MVTVDFDINIQDYVDLIQQRNRPPADELSRCELLAIELVEGQSLIFWDAQIAEPNRKNLMRMKVSVEQLGFLQYYYYKRWRGNPPDLKRLQELNLLDDSLSLLPAAYRLYEQHLRRQIKVFVSYKRSESSVLALYLHEKLEDCGYTSFLDVQSIQAGENWKFALQRSIQDCNYFVLLIGKKTFGSSVVVQEIKWAFANNMTIIPIWHNGFNYQFSSDHPIMPQAFKNLLTDTHTLIVHPENPAQYKQAISDLMKYFEMELDKN